MNISNIPEEILLHIKGFLRPKDWANTVISLNLELVRHSIMLELNKEDSRKYYFDEEFRNATNKKVVHKNQISLKLFDLYKVKDVSALGNVHTLYLNGCNKITDNFMT